MTTQPQLAAARRTRSGRLAPRAGTRPTRSAIALRALLVLTCPAVGSTAPATAAELEPEARQKLVRIIETRGFTRGLPRKPVPSPDGSRVYFLRSGPRDRIQRLYVYEVESGETRLFLMSSHLTAAVGVSKEEQARRERQRETEAGLTSFEVSRDGRRLLVPYMGDIFVVDADSGSITRLTETPQPEIDPHLSPDGKHVAFVREDALFVGRSDGSKPPRRLTPRLADGTGTQSFAIAEFVAQEEMGRSTGHWWSRDSRRLALTQVRANEVPTFRVPDFNDPTGEGSAGPYPKPGDTNAQVDVGIVHVGAPEEDVADGSAVRLFDLGQEYLARVHWAPDGGSLWVQTQPRSQKRIDVWRVDVESGRVTLVWREEDPDWVNLHDSFHLLDDGERFLWSSERSGLRQLEIIGADGRRERTLTPADMNVQEVVHVDEDHREVWFTGRREDIRERHVYRVRLAGGEVGPITSEPGWHEAHFHENGHDLFVESFSDDRTPTRHRVRDRDGKILGELPSAAAVPTPEDLGPEPEFFRLETETGVPLDIRIVRPRGRASQASLPLVVYVYGGPHAQQARNRWVGERGLFDGWLAERGFVVVRIDGRGVWGRGHDSERIYAGRLGERELADQAAGVRELLERVPQIDPNRIGVWGWSYGGYMTLMALMREPEVFRAGVAVAPVVDWHGYDTHYTERYLGLPSENTDGYEASSVLTYVPGLRGHLTLVHGASDDNVHMRESMILTNELVKAGKQFDLMIYPGTHMIQTVEERSHLYELIWRAFADNL
ncbi:MAG: DPP IV N-terminal domain-containing protein [Candidatus Krumholzibacteriia bacterium]